MEQEKSDWEKLLEQCGGDVDKAFNLVGPIDTWSQANAGVGGVSADLEELEKNIKGQGIDPRDFDTEKGKGKK